LNCYTANGADRFRQCKKEFIMDLGGINLALIEIVGVALLGLALLYAVIRTKSRGKQDSNPTTERATKELYAEEDRARKAGTDDDA